MSLEQSNSGVLVSHLKLGFKSASDVKLDGYVDDMDGHGVLQAWCRIKVREI